MRVCLLIGAVCLVAARTVAACDAATDLIEQATEYQYVPQRVGVRALGSPQRLSRAVPQTLPAWI